MNPKWIFFEGSKLQLPWFIIKSCETFPTQR